MSKQTFMLGFIAGVTSVGGEVQKEPVAYLYNGVRLPKLPEWDKTAYPYAALGTSNKGYTLVLERSEITVTSNGLFSGSTMLGNVIFNLSDAEWVKSANTISVSVTAVWTNTDLFVHVDGNKTDTVYLTASEPVPIYQ